jgi:hypothetical protein
MARGFDPARQLFAAALSLALCGCPHQELAPLLPCTVSIVSVEASQSGTDKVDLLFVIDNSASMSEEQVKLNAQLDRLVQVLTTGDFDGMRNANGELDFKPVGSLRLGVTSVDLGSNGVNGLRSCGSNSFLPTDQNVAAQGADSIDRPFGDDALLLNDTSVAVAGVSVQDALGGALGGMPMVAIQPRPECAVNVPRLLEYASGGDAQQIAAEFGCVAELGVNGCNFEQQLESTWKALAPSTDRSFSRMSGGQGPPAGLNAGFLRPDAILAIVVVTDEEDCSAPDANSQALLGSLNILQINDLCGGRPDLLHPVQRYIDGLKSLKTDAYQDYIIFAGIVGVPLAAATRGQSLSQILMRPDMQYAGGFLGQARPACTAAGGAGTATPARRIVQVAQGFGENGVITSICEDNYTAALDAVISKIAGKLSGQCLPRSLRRNAEGKVDCRVVEIKAAGDRTPCDPAHGRIKQLPDRYLNNAQHMVCEIQQLQVTGRAEPPGVGWYYDDFSNAVNSCQTNRQRIAFTSQAAVGEGASARFECFQSVAASSRRNARGSEAIGTSCADDGSAGPHGDAKCRALSTQDARLTCISGLCQQACMGDSDCPPAYVCNAADAGSGFCENPTGPLESAAL